MNLLLLEDPDFLPDGSVELRGRRAAHAHAVLGARPGEALRVGRIHGSMGQATVLACEPERLRLAVQLDRPPPPRPGVDVLLAMPRPKALKKVLPALASLGVDTVVLLNAARVEKSYFSSKVMDPAFVREQLLAGLEQAQDTVLPRVLLRERFRPFVEDELDALFPQSRRILAHPAAPRALPEVLGPPVHPARDFQAPATRRVLLAIGPEGGWVPFEVSLLERSGFVPASAGPRTLRVEAAVPYLLGQVASRYN